MAIDGRDGSEDETDAADRISQLLERVARGDQDAFAALYDALSARVFGLILRVLIDRAQSEEVLQEVFLEVWQSAARFTPDKGPGRSWVLTIAHRRAVDRLRASQASVDRDSPVGIADRDAEAASALAESAPEAAPPEEVRHHLLTHIALAPQTDAIPIGTEPPPDTGAIQTQSRTRWMRSLFALAASFVVLIAIGFTAVSINDMINRPPASVAALEQVRAATDAQSAQAWIEGGGDSTVYWSESLGKAVIVSDGLPQISEDQSFELWFVRGRRSIAAGAYDPSGEGPQTWLLQGEMRPGDTIAITIEPHGGSADGTPSGAKIVEIPT